LLRIGDTEALDRLRSLLAWREADSLRRPWRMMFSPRLALASLSWSCGGSVAWSAVDLGGALL